MVILDEPIEINYDPSKQARIPSFPTAVSQPPANIPSEANIANKSGKMSSIITSSQSPLQTPSMLNWDKTAFDLLNSATNPSSNDLPSPSRGGMGAEGGSDRSEAHQFKVDDVSMYIANNCVDDYYVVL